MHTIYPEYSKKLEDPARDEKAYVILSEIGYEHMASATSFVLYIHDKYGISESTVWYTLKKLKRQGLLEFGSRGEGKPLELTRAGISAFRSIIAVRVRYVQPSYELGMVRGMTRS